ncbi:bifunctional phosphatase PAP2/O-acyltransferase family protein [Actinomadura opuntiae]|uniref:bifunctional phosphatase PAP2/O-acyltransferase family protein n=1 Tax=Actinomadura sp. OS1-43 TaxID=604315 RepID=UPI00255AC020|nr:wax ester/triacylglycerol synthase domain-containing protein [Actinomadura sp. OS1-43]MDL4816171.1 wax ester/triacylglycerol synthase family O-acyltransferase [Actinomadura sp. OS1-43]
MGTQDAVTAQDAVLARDGTGTRARASGEVLLGLALFGLYSLVAMLPEQAREHAARRHGALVHGLERALHLDVEPALNGWLAGRPGLRLLADYEYATTYAAAAFALLVWLFLRHPERYRTARNAFVMINVVAIACFALFPVAPWGSPPAERADRLAAVPSLPMAWTLWVGAELARAKARRWVRALNGAHIAVTAYVIVAAADHHVLDAVAAVPLVALSVLAAGRLAARPQAAERVPAQDAFFLAVETGTAPQHAGGVIMLDTSRRALGRLDLVRLIGDRLDRLPRFRQRLADRGRWRRPVWLDHPAVDWSWHVTERDVDGMDGLRAMIAEIQAEPLPRDRPLWRMILVTGAAPGRTTLVFLMHHVVADGVGVVAQAISLMEPAAPAPGASAVPDGPKEAAPPPRRRVREALAGVVGLAQLAADSGVGAAPPARLPAAGTAERRFGTLRIPLDDPRTIARRHGTRVSDVVMCAVAGGLARTVRPAGGEPPRECRVAVPLMMRSPGQGMEGNHTTAVMVDLPIGAMPEAERLAEIARRSRVLRSGTRALAAWFVMRQVGRLMPAPLHARFARAVYGGRFLQGIVSSLPASRERLLLTGVPVTGVYPVVPLAPGAPLAVAALGVDRELCFGICADTGLVDDAGALAAAVRDVVRELRDE